MLPLKTMLACRHVCVITIVIVGNFTFYTKVTKYPSQIIYNSVCALIGSKIYVERKDHTTQRDFMYFLAL